jgi:hypothetical protein
MKIALIPIGAPYLYLPELRDLGPIKDWLLAVPGHGIAVSTRHSPWIPYLKAVEQTANQHKSSRVTVLIYPEDDTPELREEIREFGFVPASCGRIGDFAFVPCLRDFIRQHAAVTSDRLCTAGMYALYENRPFWLAGMGTITNQPPDAYEDLVANSDWIASNYPGIWRGGLDGRNEALLELGEKRSPIDLCRQLYWWIWEGA